MCGANDRLLDELLPAAWILAGKCVSSPRSLTYASGRFWPAAARAMATSSRCCGACWSISGFRRRGPQGRLRGLRAGSDPRGGRGGGLGRAGRPWQDGATPTATPTASQRWSGHGSTSRVATRLVGFCGETSRNVRRVVASGGDTPHNICAWSRAAVALLAAASRCRRPHRRPSG